MEDILNDSLSNVKDAIIEGLREETFKLQQIVESLESRISKLDFEDFHRLGKCGNNTIVRLDNKRTCKKVLEKMEDCKSKLDNAKLGFYSDVKNLP